MKVKVPIYVDTDSKLPYQGGRVEKLAHQLMDEQISKTSKKKVKLQLNSLYGQFGKKGAIAGPAGMKRGKPVMDDQRELSGILIDIKIADAAIRRDKNSLRPNSASYEAISDAAYRLYNFLREKPIGYIERMITGA